MLRREIEADVLIHGSGFAGCLLALVLRSLGKRVSVVDRSRHPRFAIGESSTPAADIVLESLCREYNIPELLPLTRYGRWKRERPWVNCGPKRGFSYFHHQFDRPYQAAPQRANELLVAASSTDENSDSQWYRPDVDAYFASLLSTRGIPLLEEVRDLKLALSQGTRDPVTVNGFHEEQELHIRAKFFVDGGGARGRLIPPSLVGIGPELRTRSRSIYGHFRNLKPWHDCYVAAGGDPAGHPYRCDESAVHQIIPGGWMWQLPFDNGITSAGFALDESKWPVDESQSPVEEWRSILSRFPSLADQFASVQPAPFFSEERPVVRVGRLQHRVQCCAGDCWAVLPFTAGFIDPLYSTGFGMSLLGIERLAPALACTDLVKRTRLLEVYSTRLLAEIDVVDRIDSLSYRSFGLDPRLFHAASTLYFAAATTWEQRRVKSNFRDALLLADDPQWLQVLDVAEREFPVDDSNSALNEYATNVERIIAPFNHVGLFHPQEPNMYRYTAADKGPQPAG